MSSTSSVSYGMIVKLPDKVSGLLLNCLNTLFSNLISNSFVHS